MSKALRNPITAGPGFKTSNGSGSDPDVFSGGNFNQGVPGPLWPETVTRETLAKVLGVSVRVITDLAARGIVVKAGRGLYAFQDSIVAYCAHLRDMAAGRGSGDAALNLTAERAKLASIQAEEKALKVAKTKGELVEAEAVAREWMAMLQKVRAGVLAVPPRIEARLKHLSPGDMAEIDREIRSALEELGRDA